MSVSTVAGAQGAVPTAHAARAAKVTLRHTRLGNILATSSGFTLYEFTHDHSSANTCVHISECSDTWPALQTSGRPTAGPGVRASLLSTTRLPDGKTQVTYAGHPLYLYSGDSATGRNLLRRRISVRRTLVRAQRLGRRREVVAVVAPLERRAQVETVGEPQRGRLAAGGSMVWAWRRSATHPRRSRT